MSDLTEDGDVLPLSEHSDNIFDYFPFEKVRENQQIALEWLAKSDAKFLLLESPVGSGKSAIGMCLSAFLRPPFGSSFILTPQRILQKQYEDSFKGIASLYGKSNYTCHPKRTSCDVGSLVTPKCPRCPYTGAVVNAIKSSNTVMNYKLALLAFTYTPMFAKSRRKLMILDECHTLEEQLTEINAISISFKKAKKYDVADKWPESTKLTLFTALDWVKDIYLPAAQRYLHVLYNEVEPLLKRSEYGYGDDPLSQLEIRKIREYSSLEDHIHAMTEFVLTERSEIAQEYVLVFDKQSFKFKLLYGASNMKILEMYSDRFLMMSSTILSKRGFCEDLGLPPNDTDFLSVGSEFKKENRRVVYIPSMKMNASWNDENRARERITMMSSIKQVIALHGEENGLIHTGNFKISEWLVDNLEEWPEARHQFVHHNPSSQIDRNFAIGHFIDTDVPSILISPSSTEGLDLVDDLARFAIFIKIPFPFLGDQWIKRRMQLSQEWYRRQALVDVIQGGGRIVRSNTDWGTVYILDGSWGYLYSTTKNTMVPGWWKEAYTVLTDEEFE